MFDWITKPDAWLALGTLTILEIVLGIDNIVFLSVVVNKLPLSQQTSAHRLGLLSAMVMRLGLLVIVAWIKDIVKPLLYFMEHPISARDFILFLGGIFLTWKSCTEIVETCRQNSSSIKRKKNPSYISVITQIMILDIILSLDSVITAVALSSYLFIMMAAVIVAVVIMLFAARSIGKFVDGNPSIKILALAFLTLIGISLVLESVAIDVPKEHIYSAVFFSLTVEVLNLLRNKRVRKGVSSDSDT